MANSAYTRIASEITMLTNSQVPTDKREAPHGTLSDVGRELASRPYARRGVSPSGEMIRVLLVDDHNLVRAGVKLVLRAFPEIVVVGEASDGNQALALATRLRPDIVVMDLDMPNGDGITATRSLQQELPGVRVLIVTMHTEEERLLPLLAAGARGFLSKAAVDRDLGDAIRVIASGDIYVRPAVSNELAKARFEKAPEQLNARARLERLSKREQSVLTLTARGYNGPEIGSQLGITAKTVDTYKQRIEDKLGMSHRAEYVRFAIEAGVLGES